MRRLRRLLRGCDVVVFDESVAHAVGRLLGRAGTSDVVDATVMIVATDRQAQIVTADRRDLARLAGAIGSEIELVDV